MTTKPVRKRTKKADPARRARRPTPITEPSAPRATGAIRLWGDQQDATYAPDELRAELSRLADQTLSTIGEHCASPRPEGLAHLALLRHLLHALAMRKVVSLRWSRVLEKAPPVSWERLEEYLLTLIELTRAINLAFVEQKLSARSYRSGNTIPSPSSPPLFLTRQFLEALPPPYPDAGVVSHRTPDIALAVDALRKEWWQTDCHYQETVVDPAEFSSWAASTGIVSRDEISRLLAIGATGSATLPVTALSRAAAHQNAILSVLRDLGLDPKALPKSPSGKPGVKSRVKGHLLSRRAITETTFEHSWERMRREGTLKDKPDDAPNPQ